jgi:hypothetical protein
MMQAVMITRMHREIPDEVFRGALVAGVALIAFLALPWLLMACRTLGMPGWIYGAEPLLGWLRVWAMLPAWLMLVAIVALVFVAFRSVKA